MVGRNGFWLDNVYICNLHFLKLCCGWVLFSFPTYIYIFIYDYRFNEFILLSDVQFAAEYTRHSYLCIN